MNPFTREPVILKPKPDVADVVVDGSVVGKVYWSLSEDEPLVNVSIERSSLPLALEWAAELGGEFREDVSPSEEENDDLDGSASC